MKKRYIIGHFIDPREICKSVLIYWIYISEGDIIQLQWTGLNANLHKRISKSIIKKYHPKITDKNETPLLTIMKKIIKSEKVDTIKLVSIYEVWI